jgi:hypothetical protein
MRAPNTIDVLDQHGGFTAITTSPTYIKIILDPVVGEREATLSDYAPTLIHPFVRWDRVWQESNTLWRPGSLLRKGTIGTLVETRKHSFWQNNQNVTKAIYKVPGYRYRVAVWFDNNTGRRLA